MARFSFHCKKKLLLSLVMKSLKMSVFVVLFCVVAGSSYMGCAGKNDSTVPPVDNTSLSEIVTGVLAGAINATDSAGSRASRQIKPLTFLASLRSSFNFFQEASAQVFSACVGLQNGGSPCGNDATYQTMPLRNCAFGTNFNHWNGTETYISKAGSTPFTCTTMPNFVNGDTIQRNWAIGTSRRVSVSSLAVLVDASNTSSGWQTPIATAGETFAFTAAHARNVTIAVHISGSISNYVVWDYTIATAAPFLVTNLTPANGSINTQVNRTNQTAVSSWSGITFTPSCCYPSVGTMTTVITPQSGPAITENLVYNAGGCGSATLNGNPIFLNHCF